MTTACMHCGERVYLVRNTQGDLFYVDHGGVVLCAGQGHDAHHITTK